MIFCIFRIGCEKKPVAGHRDGAVSPNGKWTAARIRSIKSLSDGLASLSKFITYIYNISSKFWMPSFLLLFSFLSSFPFSNISRPYLGTFNNITLNENSNFTLQVRCYQVPHQESALLVRRRTKRTSAGTNRLVNDPRRPHLSFESINISVIWMDNRTVLANSHIEAGPMVEGERG